MALPCKRVNFKFPSITSAMDLDCTLRSWSYPGRIFYDIEDVLFYNEEQEMCKGALYALCDTMNEMEAL